VPGQARQSGRGSSGRWARLTRAQLGLAWHEWHGRHRLERIGRSGLGRASLGRRSSAKIAWQVAARRGRLGSAGRYDAGHAPAGLSFARQSGRRQASWASLGGAVKVTAGRRVARHGGAVWASDAMQGWARRSPARQAGAAWIDGPRLAGFGVDGSAGSAWHRAARPGKGRPARPGVARPSWHGKARLGQDWPCRARPSRQVMSRQGTARLGWARPSRLGMARIGTARQSTARRSWRCVGSPASPG
jgi:hypothetical protein